MSKACFTSKEQVVTPSSSLHSLAAAAISLKAVEISVALLPYSNPKVCTSSQLLSLFLHVPRFHFQQDGEASAVPLGQDTLHSDSSRLSLQSVHHLPLRNENNDVSQPRLNFFVFNRVSSLKRHFDSLQGSPTESISEAPLRCRQVLPLCHWSTTLQLCMITDIVSFGSRLAPLSLPCPLLLSSHSSSSFLASAFISSS